MLILILCIFFTFFIIITAINIISTTNDSEKHELAYASLLIDQTSRFIERYVDDIDNIARQFQANTDIRDFFTVPKWAELIDAKNKLSSIMTAHIIQNKIASITLFNDDRKYIYNKSEVLYFNDPIGEAGQITYTNIYANNAEQYFYCLVPVTTGD